MKEKRSLKSLFMEERKLDEMQKQTMMKIEHNGMWLALWGLLAAILIQSVFHATFRQFAGEWFVFMVLGVYLIIAELKAGIWGDVLKAGTATSLLVSAIAAAAMFVYGYMISSGAWGVGIIIAVVTFILAFTALQIVTSVYRKRHKSLEEVQEEDCPHTDDTISKCTKEGEKSDGK